MTVKRKWTIRVMLCLSVGILTWVLAYPRIIRADGGSSQCSLSTLHGRYVFTGTGRDNHGNLIAESGWEIYNGDGTMSAEYSESTNGTITSNSTYTGTYTLNSDCSGTLTTNDDTHYDQFTGPSGDKFTWIETDPGFTFSGSQWRVDNRNSR
jgi:hypothetical protein